MLQQPEPDDYVLATGETHTIEEFLDEAFSIIGIHDWSKYVIKDPKFYRPAEVDVLRGDYSKAKEILGWQPKTTFTELIYKMVMTDIQLLQQNIGK
jgi:GDPmannose 4,6-dehydratase